MSTGGHYTGTQTWAGAWDTWCCDEKRREEKREEEDDDEEEDDEEEEEEEDKEEDTCLFRPLLLLLAFSIALLCLFHSMCISLQIKGNKTII